MKITFFRLKGYIKVLNGMGLDEISLDFSQFKNRIVLIQGENGCSKSTIVSALTPNPDGSDSFRTDVFIDDYGNRQIVEYPGEKEIHYIGKDECGNDAYYQILIKSIVDESKTRRTTKAFISKNGEELNPNGNVTSFKEIRDVILGIDPTYLDLSSISAENRGIVDMLPSDRRKYMAAYIGSLDTYNNIYKVISKKVTSLKSYMNTLNSKIYELGNENELRLQLIQLESSLEEKNKTRDNLLKQLAEAEAIVNIIDPENKIQSVYASISDRLISINGKIRENTDRLLALSTSIAVDYQNINIDQMMHEIEETINTHTEKLNSNKNNITVLISLNESTLQNINKDKSILSGIESNIVQTNIEKTVNDLTDEFNLYKSYISDKDICILEKISIDNLLELRNCFEDFNKEISVAEELYSDDIFQEAVDCICSNKKEISQKQITSMSSLLASNEANIINIKNQIESTKLDIEKFKEFKSMRPANCHIDDCPYISNYVSMINNIGTTDDIEKMELSIKQLETDNANLISELDHLNKLLEILAVLDNAVSILYSKKSTIKNIEELSYICDVESLKKCLKVHYRFNDFSIVTSIIEKYYIYDQMKKVDDQLKSLEGDLKVYKNNKSLQDKLSNSISTNESIYKERETNIKNITKDCAFISNIIDELSAKLNSLRDIKLCMDQLNNLEHDKSKLKEEFDSVKDKIKTVKEKMDSLNDIKNNIQKIEESIGPLNDSINQIKYNLSTIINYQYDFKDSSDKYEKMIFIRNACSPGNGMGIQSEYIKRYMNDIIIDCNKMLGYMFGGQIQLDVPVIDEKHFSIPFLGPNGIIVPDVSCGSTAQKCMIGLVFSCVAMIKSSTRYNIPRFDEIDGGLDQQNRIVFINVLNNILDFMGCEQCVIVSHNNEFDTQSTTRLICSHSGIKIEQ